MVRHQDVTGLLRDWVEGKDGAMDDLIHQVLPELRQLAKSWLAREGGRHSLQPTEIVHEAFMKLARTPIEGFDSRGHFFALASRLVREVLVDHARARSRIKRGGGVDRLSLDSATDVPLAPTLDLETVLLVDELLADLKQRDPRQGQVVEMRFFSGLTLKEIASVMGLSLATVERLWSVAKRRLALSLAAEPGRPQVP